MVRTVVRTSPAQPFQWTFLTNHAHVLVLLARNPDALLRELADAVGITERAVGRRNRYRIRADRPLRHPVEASTTVKRLLELLR
jgi:hypothetical protein